MFRNLKSEQNMTALSVVMMYGVTQNTTKTTLVEIADLSNTNSWAKKR